MLITVGSSKTYKIEAARSACELVFPEDNVEIRGISVESGVSDQPMSNAESIAGARNRAQSAMSMAPGNCLFAIGIENGLVEVDELWFANTWIVVTNAAGEEGIASSLMRPVPAAMMNLVQRGHELSTAVTQVVGHRANESHHGLIGLMTRDILRKQDVLRDGIITAFSPLIHTDLFKS